MGGSVQSLRFYKTCTMKTSTLFLAIVYTPLYISDIPDQTRLSDFNLAVKKLLAPLQSALAPAYVDDFEQVSPSPWPGHTTRTMNIMVLCQTQIMGSIMFFIIPCTIIVLPLGEEMGDIGHYTVYYGCYQYYI